MNFEISGELLEEVKSQLQITFTERDPMIKNSIKSGMAFVVDKVGPVDFEGESLASIKAKDLLLNYCRYDWDGFRQGFEVDYLRDILSLQITNGIERRIFDAKKAK
ncbi:hypothetical protein PGA57_05350 [Latilactobacillus curvatus]|uniref:hypothetical protein n=1 Tax=Latilactobacillus curvatus TaxID=28038 RepID=UPI0022F40699|nr:hypothetical protein [Latilactobacillus curvatus]WBY48106.1 hypothetical protein PGA57_05350 [Latilactobacillus curvatus]